MASHPTWIISAVLTQPNNLDWTCKYFPPNEEISHTELMLLTFLLGLRFGPIIDKRTLSQEDLKWLRTIIFQEGINTWIVPSYDLWTIDLRNLKQFLKTLPHTDNKQIDSTQWLIGKVISKPRYELKKGPFNDSYMVEFEFRIRLEMLELDKKQLKTKTLDDLIKFYNHDDLKTICFRLDIEYESLPEYSTKKSLARELVRQLEREERLLELINIIEAKKDQFTG